MTSLSAKSRAALPLRTFVLLAIANRFLLKCVAANIPSFAATQQTLALDSNTALLNSVYASR